MQFDSKDPIQLVALAAAAIIVIALIASVAFKTTPQAKPSTTPTIKASAQPSALTSPKPTPLTSQQKYDYEKFLLSSTRNSRLNQDSKWEDDDTLSNEAAEPARFAVAEVYPRAGINDVETLAPPEDDPARAGETRHLDGNPLTLITDFELAPQQSVSFAARSNKNLRDAAPVRLLAAPELTAFQRSQLAPVLSKIAELALPLAQARALELKANEAFARVTQQQNAFEDYVDAVEEFVDEVHEEIAAAERATPKPRATPDVSKMKFPIPSPPKPPTKEDLRQLLPQFPASINFSVTEASPGDVKTFYLKPKIYFGQLFISLDGNAAKYVKASKEQDSAGYLITVSANVKSAIKEGKLPFDSVSGKINFKFSMLATENNSVPIIISVKHVDLDDTPEVIDEDVVELPAPNPSQPTETTKPPLNTAALSGNCAQDRATVMAVAEKYDGGEYPGDCAQYEDKACACSVNAILEEAGVNLNLPSWESVNAYKMYDYLIEHGLGVQVSEPGDQPDLSNVIEGDLVFFKTYPGSHMAISHVEIYAGNEMIIGGGSGVTKKAVRTGSYDCSARSDCDTENIGIPAYQGAVRVIPSCLNGGSGYSAQSSNGGLAGKKIFIDPGHNAATIGKPCSNGVKELELNLLVSQKLNVLLASEGATVQMSRETDASQVTLEERPQKANAFGADIIISVHHNDARGTGTAVFYAVSEVTNEQKEKSMRLGEMINERLNRVSSSAGLQPDTETQNKKLVTLRDANMPGVTVEVINTCNSLADTEDFQQKAARAIFDGIKAYFSEAA